MGARTEKPRGGSLAGMLKTGQTTAYHVGDDGDHEEGLGKQYEVLATAGTSNIEVAHYAAATLAFVNATSKITDSGNGLATFLTGDTIVVKGSTDNDGVYTVATGGVAGEIVTTEALTDESAGAVVSLYKRAAHSNNCVNDTKTGKMWSRYTSDAEKVGVASDGTLNWYDVATVFPLHPAAADLTIVLPDLLGIVGGAAEVNRYHVGDLIQCTGFANAANNLPGYYVTKVSVDAADLVITIDPVNNVLVWESAGGARTIGLVTRSIYNYAAGANLIGLGGYADWRVPDDTELASLRSMEAPTAAPDAVAFPGWSTGDYIWASTTTPYVVTQAQYCYYNGGENRGRTKTNDHLTALIRG